MDFAREIKARLETAEVFRHYGFEPNRAGFICCPFHHEKTPSMKIYDGNRGYHCFGCGENGGVIDFVMKYFAVGFREAIAKLNNDFALGLPIGEKLDRRKQLEYERQAFRRRQEAEREREKRNAALNEYHAALDEYVKADIDLMQKENTDEYFDALRRFEIIKHRLECAELRLYYDTKNR